MQFAASLVKGQGRVARKPKNSKDFSRLVEVFFKKNILINIFKRKLVSRRTAEDAFRSLVKTHDKYGWVTPALSDG